MKSMTRKSPTRTVNELKAQLAEEPDLLRPLAQLAVQEFLEAEMNEALGAAKSERTAGRLGYRSGHYPRKLVTRVGTLELRVPQDRQGRFSTEPFSRYQRSEKALVTALVERYVQGVSTRKVKAVSGELCGHEFSASTLSELNARLDEELEQFARQRLEGQYPCLIVDARYERVREDGVIPAQRPRPSAPHRRSGLPDRAALAPRLPRPGRGPPAPPRLARPLAGQVSQALRLGRGRHRGDVDLLPPAAGTPQPPQEHQPPRTAQRGTQAAHAGRAHLPPRAGLPAPDPRPRRRTARGMA